MIIVIWEYLNATYTSIKMTINKCNYCLKISKFYISTYRHVLVRFYYNINAKIQVSLQSFLLLTSFIVIKIFRTNCLCARESRRIRLLEHYVPRVTLIIVRFAIFANSLFLYRNSCYNACLATLVPMFPRTSQKDSLLQFVNNNIIAGNVNATKLVASSIVSSNCNRFITI